MGWRRDHLVGLRTSYKFYRETAEEKKVSVEMYCAILSDFMKYILDRVLAGEEVKLPERFGSLKMEGVKREPYFGKDGRIKNAAVDWKATAELRARNPQAAAEKKLVFYFNEHTNGVVNILKWKHHDSLVPFKRLLSLDKANPLKKKISKLSFEGAEYDMNLRPLPKSKNPHAY